MMKRVFTSSLWILVSGILFLTGCTNDTIDSKNEVEGFPDGFPICLSPADYNDENTYYLLNDDEPSDVFFDPNQRSFYVDQPLQLSMDDDHCFQLRFYSPRALPEVTIWAKMEGYEEEFAFLKLEKIMPFQQLRVKIPFATQDMKARTRSGKMIQIMANPHLDSKTLSFTVESGAPYYKTLQDIKCHWRITFARYDPNHQYWKNGLRAYQAREGVAIALNMAYMYSSPEFESALHAWGPLYSDGNKTVIDKSALLKRTLAQGGLKFGNVIGVNGLGGGTTYGLADFIFQGHYADDNLSTTDMFHEFAHCLGYGHSGNMTYAPNDAPGWTALCGNMYRDLSVDKKLPVYSRRFMHTRKNAKNKYTNSYYVASRNVIEDPELDALDGGLGQSEDFLETDFGETENAPALSFKLDYNAAGTGEKNFMPRCISVYGDKMYVTNDIRGANYAWEVYDLSSGKPVFEKRITEWKNPTDGSTTKIGDPYGILRSHDKIYLAGSNNCLFVFDAKTYECTSMLSLGKFNAVGMAATNGTLYAYRGVVRAFPEHDLSHGYMASSNDLGAHSGNTMTADYAGNVYAVDYNAKKMICISPKYLMACKLTAEDEVVFEANPNGAAWSSDGRLFVSFAKTDQYGPRFCEVNPKTGKIVKDFTTIGDIKLNNPGQCLIRRNTLFIVDRVGGLCVYAIPMSELK